MPCGQPRPARPGWLSFAGGHLPGCVGGWVHGSPRPLPLNPIPNESSPAQLPGTPGEARACSCWARICPSSTGRNGSGRGSDTGHTIEFDETGANRTRAQGGGPSCGTRPGRVRSASAAQWDPAGQATIGLHLGLGKSQMIGATLVERTSGRHRRSPSPRTAAAAAAAAAAGRWRHRRGRCGGSIQGSLFQRHLCMCRAPRHRAAGARVQKKMHPAPRPRHCPAVTPGTKVTPIIRAGAGNVEKLDYSPRPPVSFARRVGRTKCRGCLIRFAGLFDSGACGGGGAACPPTPQTPLLRAPPGDFPPCGGKSRPPRPGGVQLCLVHSRIEESLGRQARAGRWDLGRAGHYSNDVLAAARPPPPGPTGGQGREWDVGGQAARRGVAAGGSVFPRLPPWHASLARFSRIRAAMRTAPGARK
eukprot:gene16047-biopygen17228